MAQVGLGDPQARWVLVTRPMADAGDLMDRIKALGALPVAAPVLRITPLADSTPDLTQVQALVFTSANGARVFAALCPRRDFPVFAVGAVTAGVARDLGFPEIKTASGDVGALAGLIASECDPRAGVLYHAAGSVIARDLGDLLHEQGYAVRREILYRTDYYDDLPEAAWQALGSSGPGGILFYSANSVAGFKHILSRHAKREAAINWSNISLFCLSQYIMKTVCWPGTLYVADRPHPGAVDDMIKKWLEQTKHD